MTLSTLMAEAVNHSEKARAEAALAEEARHIGHLAREAEARRNEAAIAAVLAAPGQAAPWTPESIIRAAGWAASRAFTGKGYRGTTADWRECRDAVVLQALALAPPAPEAPGPEAEAAAQAARSRRSRVECDRACKALTVAMEAEAAAATLLASSDPRSHRIGRRLALRAEGRRAEAARRYRAAALAEDAPLNLARPEAAQGRMPTVEAVNATYLLGEALTWTKRRMSDPEAEAAPKGRRIAQAQGRVVSAEDLAEALTVVRGTPATKLERAFLLWALSVPATARQKNVKADGLSKAEACLLVDLAESNADNFKRAAASLRKVDLKALEAEAQAEALQEARDWTPAARAAVWFSQASARQSARRNVDRSRGLALRPGNRPATARTEALYGPALIPAPEARSLAESGLVRRRPLYLARVTWQANRRKARRMAQARRLLARPPLDPATIAAPRIYAMPTPVVPTPWKAASKPHKRPAPEARGLTYREPMEPMPRTVSGAAVLARPRPLASGPDVLPNRGAGTVTLRGETAEVTAEAMAARDLAVARTLAEAAMAAALAERPRKSRDLPLSCPVAGRPDALQHRGEWGEPMLRPEGLTARL